MVSVSFTLSAALAVIAGLVVLFFPKLLRFGLGLYLIIVGILQMLGL